LSRGFTAKSFVVLPSAVRGKKGLARSHHRTWLTRVVSPQFRSGYGRRCSAEFIRRPNLVARQFGDSALSQSFNITIGGGTDHAQHEANAAVRRSRGSLAIVLGWGLGKQAAL